MTPLSLLSGIASHGYREADKCYNKKSELMLMRRATASV